VMLVVGTSAVVQPAAMIPVIAKQSGALIIEINPQPTPLSECTSDYILKGTAGKVLTSLVTAVNKRLA